MQAAPKPIILRERGGRRATRHCTQQDNGMLLRNEREEGGNTAARRAGRVKRGMILREEEEEEARELHDLTQMSVCTTYSQRTAWSDVCASLQADCLSLRGDEITGSFTFMLYVRLTFCCVFLRMQLLYTLTTDVFGFELTCDIWA